MNKAFLTTCLALMMASLCGSALAQDDDSRREEWQTIVRESPYWVSQGVYRNILDIRRWVIGESGYCSEPERHILYGRRGEFLGYIDNAASREITQQRLNDTRRDLASRGRTDVWARGSDGQIGYPFALACDQPHVELDESVARYMGTLPADLIWGTWDDLQVGNKNNPQPLHDTLMMVYNKRLSQQRLNLPPELPRYLAAQLLIESGGQQRAHSAAGAKGILQLSAPVLDDCGIAQAYHWHRLAQIDCALRLMSQNARNLREPFEARFGNLPKAKQNRLFTLLLVQAYHGGAGRVESLLSDETLSAPAVYFARHHERYQAGDIAFGMIFHNLGRNRLGLASLYYVADVELAAEALCQTARLQDEALCQ